MPTRITRTKRNRRPLLFAAAAAVVALLLVVSGVYFISTPKRDTGDGIARPSQPTAEKQAGWQPITNARVAREAVATTRGRRHHLDFRRRWRRTTASADATRAMTLPLTTGRAATTYPFRCSMRCR